MDTYYNYRSHSSTAYRYVFCSTRSYLKLFKFTSRWILTTYLMSNVSKNHPNGWFLLAQLTGYLVRNNLVDGNFDHYMVSTPVGYFVSFILTKYTQPGFKSRTEPSPRLLNCAYEKTAIRRFFHMRAMINNIRTAFAEENDTTIYIPKLDGTDFDF